MFSIKQEIEEGQHVPIGYGIAYHDYIRDRVVCYPMPLSNVIGLFRNVYFYLAKGFYPTTLDNLLRKECYDAYKRGYSEGYEKGFSDSEFDHLRATHTSAKSIRIAN